LSRAPTSEYIRFSYIHHPVKMIGHQAPGHYISVWQNIFFHFTEKEKIILPVEKYFLSVITLIVNVVDVSFFY